jgi:hypothetical protein
MATLALVTVANKSKVITKSTFSGYDACINPYVGCEFGCSYCYVRFFTKDKNKPWGLEGVCDENPSDAVPATEVHGDGIIAGRYYVSDDYPGITLLLAIDGSNVEIYRATYQHESDHAKPLHIRTISLDDPNSIDIIRTVVRFTISEYRFVINRLIANYQNNGGRHG